MDWLFRTPTLSFRTYPHYVQFGYLVVKSEQVQRATLLLFTFLLTTIGVLGQSGSVEEHLDLANEYIDLVIEEANMDKALEYADKMCMHCEKTGLDTMMMQCHFHRGGVYFYRGEYDKAMESHQTSLRLAKETGDRYYQLYNYSAIGGVESTIGDSDAAIRNLRKGLEIAEELRDSINIGTIYENLGAAYVDLSASRPVKSNARQFLLKAAKVYTSIDAGQEYLVPVYDKLSKASETTEERLRYINMAIEIVERLEMGIYPSLCYSTKAIIYFDEGNFEEAIKWNLKSLQAAEEDADEASIEVILLDLTNSYFHSGDTDKSLELITLYQDRFDKNELLMDNRKLFLDLASKIYKEKGDLEKAFAYSQELAAVTDSLSERQLHDRFIKYNKQFELEEKNKELAEQQLATAEERASRDRMIGFFIIGALLILGIVAFVYFRQQRAKQLATQQLEQEREMNDLRTTFLENVAHEIRTPITLINGYLKLADDEIQDEKASRNIKNAMSSSKKVLSNANEILELLKSEKGKLPIVLEDIQLDAFLKRILFSFESLGAIKGIRLNYFSDVPASIWIKSDPGRLEKILNNFISNALKFSPSDEEVVMTVQLKQKALSVSVRDSGPGIDTNEKEKVFERFYQSPRTRKVGGVGVGLSLARDFAQSLQGDVAVESELGKGALFTLTLPVEPFESTANVVEEKKSSEREERKDLWSDGTKHKVLVVEDNPEMSAYLKEILSAHYECDQAFNGIEGLQAVRTKKYQMIISDVMMPEMDGIEFRKKVNGIANYQNTPFIFLTAKAELSDRIEGYQLGVDDYMTKPFDKDELLVRMQNLFKAKKERENWVKDNLDFIGDNEGSTDEQLLAKIKTIVQENLSNEEFKTGDLADQIGYSSRQLSRITNKLTGMSTVQFILELRLQKAYVCLTEKKFATLAEVRHYVGIPTASHFNKKFYERFGKKPSEV